MVNTTQQNRLTLTKQELRDILGCTTWTRFYKIFMTDHVITNELGIDKEEYGRIREFTVEQTRILIRYFELGS